MNSHFISATCLGEACNICGAPAAHKVGEEIASDAPAFDRQRHNLTAYVCCKCYRVIMGPIVVGWCPGVTQ